MRGRYTQVPADTFKKLAMNAGIMAKSFNPSTGAVSGILGATTGGISFQATPEYQDFGDDVDNMPKNTMEMKQITDITVQASGTLLTIDNTTAKSLMAAADIDVSDTTKIIPRMNLKSTDFEDIWIIVDYSDENTGENAGYVAIHLMNALNTGGFQITTADRAKGQFPFTYQAHYSLDEPEKIPYEVYVKGGDGTTTPSILLDKHTVTIADGDEVTLNATVVPAGATVTWGSASTSVATVANGVVTGEGAGNTIITASITQNGVAYSDTCTVIVTA